tara:strand:- start:1846 stop:2208 length:363 start_codon:yes stop_codon:yes gene_type:complete
MNKPINIKSKFDLFTDHWSPKVIAEMNNYQFKLVKIKGEFIWHNHKDTDEVFIVIEGSMNIDLINKTRILNSGDMIVIKKGEEHKPYSKDECKVLIIEPKGVINTGDEGGILTAENDKWI